LIFLIGCVLPGAAQQQGMTVTGSVWLPDGKPAHRVKVRLTGRTGVGIDVMTDTSGRYETTLPFGRYRAAAFNPQSPEQFTDPVEFEGNRANSRLVVHLFLRLPDMPARREARPNVVSVAEASQNIPKEARTAYKDGVKLRERKQNDKALVSLSRAIELYPGYFQALTERGEVHVNLGQITEAAQDFDAAIGFNKDYEPALRGAGFCRLEQQKYSEAIEFFERAILIDPSRPQSHLFLGAANLVVGRAEPAKTALIEALRLDPEEAAAAHIYLSNLYASEQRYKEAADELKKYLSARPNAPDAPRLKLRESELRKLAKDR
jgi:tetratricopeptide (TPR) repeat protein